MVIGEVPIEIGLPQLAVVGQPVGALEVTEVAIAVPVVLTLTVSVALGVPAGVTVAGRPAEPTTEMLPVPIRVPYVAVAVYVALLVKVTCTVAVSVKGQPVALVTVKVPSVGVPGAGESCVPVLTVKEFVVPDVRTTPG